MPRQPFDQEFSLLHRLGFEVAILTLVGWIEIGWLRCALRQQNPTLLAREGTDTASLAPGAKQLAAHVDDSH